MIQVNVKYIKLNEKKKYKMLIIILLFLIVLYFLLQYFESSEVISSKIHFNETTENMKFYLGGEICGIKLLASGVLVVEVDNKKIDLNPGDVILRIGDKEIESNQELVDYLNNVSIKGEKVVLTVEKNGKKREVKATPMLNIKTGMYELGIWVKDSSAGVGMITFYEVTNKKFAALGHGITETSENIVVPISSGAIVKSKVLKLNKGSVEAPGDIRGTIYKDVLGQIRKNTLNGIYGTLETDELIKNKNNEIEVLPKDEIKPGKAFLYCTLEDEKIEEFEIEIKNIFYDSKTNKNMIIKITDDNLIKKTGGIIQGMSGSPIVQDGKLVGAVTHVFLNDPTMGYAVFIENMINDMNSME